MYKSERCCTVTLCHNYWSSSDSLIHSSAGVKRQAGQRGNSAFSSKRFLLLTACSRVLLEKLVKKFPTVYGTWRFITTFTTARHLSLFWASWIQSIPPHPTARRSILILSSHLRLGLPSNYNRILIYFIPRAENCRKGDPDIVLGILYVCLTVYKNVSHSALYVVSYPWCYLHS